jgi:hypothetical protein
MGDGSAKWYAVVVALAIAAGVALRWPVFRLEACSDDYFQYAMVAGVFPIQRSFLDLCKYSDGTAQDVALLMDSGGLPWWSHPNFRLSMMRPLSNALTALDYRLFGANLAAHHLHSLLWWALLVAAVALLLREVLPARIAAVAVLLFSVEEGNRLPLAWLANRSASICLSLGLLGLFFHLRRRRAGLARAPLPGVSLFALALLAGEWAFPVMAYLIAFEVFGSRGSAGERLRALLPYALLCLAFIVAHGLLRYGAFGSGVYVDLFAEPAAYLLEALQRIPVFFAELVFGLNASWWNDGSPWRIFFLQLDLFSLAAWKRLPDWRFWHVLIGLAAVVIGLALIRRALRDRRDRVPRELGWLLCGSLLALLPMVSALTMSRSVLPAFIGVSSAWAVVLLHGFRCLRRSLGQKSIRASLLPLLVVSGTLYCQVWVASHRSYVEMQAYAYWCESVRDWALQAEIDDDQIEDRQIVLVNGIEHTVAFYTPFIRHLYGHALPRSFRVLSSAPLAHDVERTADNVLEMAVLGGTLLDSELERFFRSPRFPFRAGDNVSLTGMRIEIRKLLRGKPQRVRLVFDRPLDDPGYLFLHSSESGMRRFDLPRVGERLRLPIARYPDKRWLRPGSQAR